MRATTHFTTLLLTRTQTQDTLRGFLSVLCFFEHLAIDRLQERQGEDDNPPLHSIDGVVSRAHLCGLGRG